MHCIICGELAEYDSPHNFCATHWSRWFYHEEKGYTEVWENELLNKIQDLRTQIEDLQQQLNEQNED